MTDVRDAMITALEHSKKYTALLAENERLERDTKVLHANIASLRGELESAKDRFQLVITENQRLGENREYWQTMADSRGSEIDVLKKELTNLRGATSEPRPPLRCASCEHWETPEAWKVRNPDDHDEDPRTGECHENPCGAAAPPHHWCSKHKERKCQ
jgi:hypothetical protein